MVYEERRVVRRRRTGTAVRRRRGSGTTEQRESKTAGRLIACIWILFLAVAGRLMFPQSFENVRAWLLSAVAGDVDYKAAVTVLGEAVRGEENVGEALRKAYEYAFTVSADEGLIEAHNDMDDAPGDIPAVSIIEQPETEAEMTTQEYVGTVSDEVVIDRPYPQNTTADTVDLSISLSPPIDGEVTSGFGYRVHPVSGEITFHYGTDYAAEEGETVRCAADGTVQAVGDSATYGLYVIIDHGSGVKTLYAHLGSTALSDGQKVTSGGAIGTAGKTGNATSPCVHFEITFNGVFVDPELCL